MTSRSSTRSRRRSGAHWAALPLALVALSCTGMVTRPGEIEDPPSTPVATDQSSRGALPRLSVREYDSSLSAIFGATADGLAERHLPQDVVAPFDTDQALKSPSEVFIGGMEALAFDLAQQVSAQPAEVQRLCDCSPSGPDDEASQRALIERLGLRLWRRPMTAEEIDPLLATALTFASDESDFYVGARLVIQSLLQSPEFVYRAEIGQLEEERARRLNSYELISRLSFLIYGQAPDEALLEVAGAQPELGTEALVALAESMLADPRADAQIRTFHDYWLGYRGLRPPAELVPSMLRETEALLDLVLIEERDRPWTDLFTSRSTFVDPMLAEHYDMPPVSEAGWVEYDNPARAGVLSHGSFLSLTAARGDDTSPTRRGQLIATRMLCWEIPEPPENVNPDMPPEREPGGCKSDAYAMHRDASSTCYSCHQLMDPIGFGLERFDGYGRYRLNEYENTDCEIAGRGDLDTVGRFSGPRELADLLVEQGHLTECGVEQFLHFSTGQEQTTADRALIRRLNEHFVSSGANFRELVLELVRDPVFLYRVEEAE